MNDSNEYTVSVIINDQYPQDYAEHAKKRAREDLVISILDKFLYKPGQPIYTIQIMDKERRVSYDSIEYRAFAKITSVNVRKIEMVALPDYSSMTWRNLSASALDEIKRRVIKKVKKFLRTLPQPLR